MRPQNPASIRCCPRSSAETEFLRSLEASKRIYIGPEDAEARKLRQLSPFHDEKPAGRAPDRQAANDQVARRNPVDGRFGRMVTDRGASGRMAKDEAGLYEYQIAATMTNVYLEQGCERSAYAPIVGSGPDGIVLHYSANRRRTDSGELVLMDVGAECSSYATDVTRTVPVNGKFTPRQREIYEIVLGAQKAAIAAIKPGARVHGAEGSLQQIAYQYIDTHGKDLLGQSLGRYFTHGLSHFVGLDVHDPGDINRPLEPGMVITIEPGIYIPEENIAVRIERHSWWSPRTGSRHPEALPRDPEEIERLVGK